MSAAPKSNVPVPLPDNASDNIGNPRRGRVNVHRTMTVYLDRELMFQ